MARQPAAGGRGGRGMLDRGTEERCGLLRSGGAALGALSGSWMCLAWSWSDVGLA